MRAGSLRPYEDALCDGGPLLLRPASGGTVQLDVSRWRADADAVDRSVLARCPGPVLDVGCGPGRIAAAIAESGTDVVGIDIAPTAVALTRARGAVAYECDVFDELPGSPRFATVLLLDGNIGIGGRPSRLLRRCADLLLPGGRVIVETHARSTTDELLWTQFSRTGEPLGPHFPWALVGRDALDRYAASAGLRLSWTTEVGGRSFCGLSYRRHCD